MHSFSATALNTCKTYLQRSWIDPRISPRPSRIEGRGLFARAPILVGEVVVIWGGRLFSEAEYRAGKQREMSTVPIGEGVYLGSFAHEPVLADEFMNHSCDPNVWLRDETTLVARRPIAIGHELTIDYALWETDPQWSMACWCYSVYCRRLITGNDWMLEELQYRYADHFSPYVQARIRRALVRLPEPRVLQPVPAARIND